MAKFHIGQTICAITPHTGFEKALITSIDDKFYHLKIMCGIATMPISAEKNYKLYTNKY